MFQLTFKLENAEGYEFMDYNLPYPNRIFHTNDNSVYWTWLIDGYFHTKTNKEYLQDIVARFLITFKEYNPRRITFEQKKLQNKVVHKLAEFSGLESIRTKRYIPRRAEMFDDFTFWAIKLYVEDYIREFGSITQDYVVDWALENFPDKEPATIRSKARNVFRWYEERDFKLGKQNKYSKEEYRDIRISSMKEYARKRAEDKIKEIKRKVKKYKKILISYINNISKLSKILGVSRNTVYKYINDIRFLLTQVITGNISSFVLYSNDQRAVLTRELINIIDINQRIRLRE